MPSLRKWVRKRNFLFWTITATISIEALLGSLFLFKNVTFDGKIGITVFTVVPGFVVTIMQLIRSHQTQQAGFIKEFLTEFRKNENLHSTYYDLVYRYRDDLYLKVQDAANTYFSQHGKKELDASEKPSFECFKDFQLSTKEGSRFFHPEFFQFSPEEAKMDGLLDYFNTIGLYLFEGLIQIEDISKLLGDYLAVLSQRKVVQEYLKFCEEKWKYSQSVGASLPYQHLKFLLQEFKVYNFREAHLRDQRELQEAVQQKTRELSELKNRLKSSR